MREQLITFDTAKLAKEKGFNISSSVDGIGSSIYTVSGKLSNTIFTGNFIYAPRQSFLQKWLREEHKIRIFPYQGVSGNFKVDIFTYPVPNNIGKWERFNNIQSYNSYEEALEIGLQEALKLI